MFGWKRSKERPLKMVWRFERDGRANHLVGTAHFIRFSFRESLVELLGQARTAVFEGPLDEESMAAIRSAGMGADTHLFDLLDDRTAAGVSQALFPGCQRRDLLKSISPPGKGSLDPARALVEGMEPWLAFFTIWSTFLHRLGWKRSVDMEGYSIAGELGCPVRFMEDVAEQVQVLRNLDMGRITGFLGRYRDWESIARGFEKSYLRGELDGIRWLSLGFPSRHRRVIMDRDHIFHRRMRDMVEEGGAVVFVGAPHVPGMAHLLGEDGWTVTPPVDTRFD